MLSWARINLSTEKALLSAAREIEMRHAKTTENDIFAKHEKLLSLLDFLDKKYIIYLISKERFHFKPFFIISHGFLGENRKNTFDWKISGFYLLFSDFLCSLFSISSQKLHKQIDKSLGFFLQNNNWTSISGIGNV